MVGHNKIATGAGFVRFIFDEKDDQIKAIAYGKSISLGIESQERDTHILTTQITNTY
jgi:hypothetical protein